VDLGPGQVRAVSLRLDSWRPPPGQEWTRQFTITASDGYTSVDASGSLVQTSSRAAIEMLGVRLDPSVLRLSGRRGVLRATIDNRNGAQPIGSGCEVTTRRTLCVSHLDRECSTSRPGR
jgi:hypothetical protein